MGNQIDIVIRAVDKNVKATFAGMRKWLNNSDRAMEAFRKTMKRTSGLSLELSGNLKAMIAGVGIGGMVTSLWDAGTTAQRLQLAFEAVSGSAAGSRQELGFVRDEAERLGLVFTSAAESYKHIFAAAQAGKVPLETTRKIFSGFSESFAALGLNGEQVTGSLRAIGQMMGKNKVLAEELRQQLGEKMPVAITAFASAAGKSVADFQKMMANGEVGIETIVKAADLLHKVYGKDAERQASQAIGALAKWKNAWYDFRVEMSNAGFLSAATDLLKSMAAALKDPGVRSTMKSLVTGFFDIARWVAKVSYELRHWIGLFAGLMVVSKTVRVLVGLFEGLSTAFVVLTGMNLGAWLTAVAGCFNAAVIAAAGLRGALASITGMGLAAWFGWEVGKLLNQFDVVKKAGIAMVAALHKAMYMAKNSLNGLVFTDKSEFDRGLKAIDDVYGAMFDKIERKSEIASNKMVLDQKKISDASQKAAFDLKDSNEQAAGKMKNAWKRAIDQVKALQDQLADNELSSAEKLREIRRTGMSDLGAWRDRYREANEYFQMAVRAEYEAQKALKAGDKETAASKYKESLTYLRSAERGYDDLNKKVEHNGRMVISEIGAAKVAYRELNKVFNERKDILEAQKKQAQAVADQVNKESGFAFAKKGIESVTASVDRFAKITVPAMGKSFSLVWEDAKKTGEAMIQTMETKTGQLLLKKREMKIKIKLQGPSQAEINRIFGDMKGVVAVAGKRLGGLIGAAQMSVGGAVRSAAAGFRFPGYGGGDRPKNLVMAEDGEVMIRKEMVRAAGVRAALAFNSGNWSVLLEELLRRFHPGGIIRRQLGGPIGGPGGVGGLGAVPAMAGASPSMYTINQHFAPGARVEPMSRSNARQNAAMMVEELQRTLRRSS